MDKKPLIIISGPTATGKSEVSLSLAKRIDGKIISADSMQVYRGMDIGTAKLTSKKRGGIDHYMIDEYEPDDEFNVMIFKDKVTKYIDDIVSSGHIPIMVGGTGFYIQAVLYDVEFESHRVDDKYRQGLLDYAKVNGDKALHDRLKNIDPVAADAIHPHNIKRVIRALEYHKSTGELISEHNRVQRERISPYDYLYVVLTSDMKILYDKINKRVDDMINTGLLDEVKSLYDRGYDPSLTSMQGLGYKELFSYYRGDYDLDEAIERIKSGTRHFAKRQMTWFRREKDVTWIDTNKYNSPDEIADEVISLSKGILSRRQNGAYDG